MNYFIEYKNGLITISEDVGLLLEIKCRYGFEIHKTNVELLKAQTDTDKWVEQAKADVKEWFDKWFNYPDVHIADFEDITFEYKNGNVAVNMGGKLAEYLYYLYMDCGKPELFGLTSILEKQNRYTQEWVWVVRKED